MQRNQTNQGAPTNTETSYEVPYRGDAYEVPYQNSGGNENPPTNPENEEYEVYHSDQVSTEYEVYGETYEQYRN